MVIRQPAQRVQYTFLINSTDFFNSFTRGEASNHAAAGKQIIAAGADKGYILNFSRIGQQPEFHRVVMGIRDLRVSVEGVKLPHVAGIIGVAACLQVELIDIKHIHNCCFIPLIEKWNYSAFMAAVLMLCAGDAGIAEAAGKPAPGDIFDIA